MCSFDHKWQDGAYYTLLINCLYWETLIWSDPLISSSRQLKRVYWTFSRCVRLQLCCPPHSCYQQRFLHYWYALIHPISLISWSCFLVWQQRLEQVNAGDSTWTRCWGACLWIQTALLYPQSTEMAGTLRSCAGWSLAPCQWRTQLLRLSTCHVNTHALLCSSNTTTTYCLFLAALFHDPLHDLICLVSGLLCFVLQHTCEVCLFIYPLVKSCHMKQRQWHIPFMSTVTTRNTINSSPSSMIS